MATSIYSLGNPTPTRPFNLSSATSFNPTDPTSSTNYGFGDVASGLGLKMPSQSPFLLGNLGGLGDTAKGGFFGNGVDLGFNAPTANLAMNGIGGILQLLGANQARKSMEAQQRIAEENLAMTKKAYDTNLDRKYRAAAHQSGATTAEVDAAGNAALNRYGTGGLLATSNLDRKTQE